MTGQATAGDIRDGIRKMTDYTKCVSDLREYLANRQIAEALEAQAREIAALRAALKDCADELETWVDDLYARGSVPAGYGTKYDRCVAAVEASRAVLKGEKE